MITTDEAKHIAKIMWDGGVKTSRRITNIVEQIKMIPDAVRVNFDAVQEYIVNLYLDETIKKGK